MSTQKVTESTLFAGRLREERLRLGLSQQEVAQAAGVRREQWGKYERGEAEPTATAIGRVAELGLDPMYVLIGERQSAQPPSQPNLIGIGSKGAAMAKEEEFPFVESLKYQDGNRTLRFVLVPRFAARASAGAGFSNGGTADLVTGEIAFEAHWMRQHVGRAGSGFALLDVHGSSMEPTLWDGETILVDLHSREVVSGSIYVLRDGDELLVKRLQRLIGGGIEVVSDNVNFRSQAVQGLDELTVIGRVVWPRVR